jgi:hypothetical protein
MASGSYPTVEEQVDRLLAAADDCGALFRFWTVCDLAHSDAINRLACCDLARDELIVTFPDAAGRGSILGSVASTGWLRRAS